MTKDQAPYSQMNFQLTNFTTDPFLVATWSVAAISWVISFIGSLVANIESAVFPKFTWWGLVYQLLLLIGIFLIYGFDMVDQYKNFLTAGLSIAFIYTTNSATSLVWDNGSAKAAAAAGVVVLSIVNLIWVFYYGADNSSPINQYVDSFSLKGPRSSSNPFHHSQPPFPQSKYASTLPENDEFKNSSWSNQRFVSSTRLNGLENLSERDTNNNTGTPIYDIPNLNNNTGTQISAGSAGTGTNLMIDDFPYTAKALYSYESSPEDENEISFEKGEILKVNDIHSRWWQAKKSNGDIGICPSNYVELIE